MKQLSLSQARRLALQAQGLVRPRPDRQATMRDVQREIDRVAQFQIDSVNVCVRAHYMPLFSRLGDYDTDLLDRAFGQSPRRLVEYWGHAASLIDVRLFRSLQFKMDAHTSRGWAAKVDQSMPGITQQVLDRVSEEGPITARGLEIAEERRRDHWGWNWSSAKIALEGHFHDGRISSAKRNSQFERVYDLAERVLPPAIRDEQPHDEASQRRELARRAALALGVFSERCLSEYFYTKRAPTRAAIQQLLDQGFIEPVSITGWPVQTWQVTGLTIPRGASGQALLSPFDSMMFQRDRIHALFDYFYRIEIYVPEAQRQYGYYVYSFLLGEELVARVDLKSDRAAGELVVKAAWLEPDREADPAQVCTALANELSLMTRWLGLGRVRVEPRGTLSPALTEVFDTTT